MPIAYCDNCYAFPGLCFEVDPDADDSDDDDVDDPTDPFTDGIDPPGGSEVK